MFLVEVKPAQLLEADDGQAGIQGVEFANLDVVPVDVIGVVKERRKPAIPKFRSAFRRIVVDAKHAVDGSLLAIEPHANIDERNAF